MAEWMNIPSLSEENPERRIHMERYEYAGSILSGKRVLDCACGMGYGSEIMRRAGCEVIGCDIDPEATKLAASLYPESAFVHGDMYQARGALEFANALVSFETLEHLERPADVINGLPQSIQDIIISAPIRPTVGWNPWHKTDFTHASLCQLVESAGFRIVHVMGQPWIDGKGDLYLMVHGKRGAWTL